jgi:hypothetical protein
MVALDWTAFDADGHASIAVYLITNHGRATPLLWQTVEKSDLEGKRNGHEDRLLEKLDEGMPEGVRVTVLADRGFGDQKRYEYLAGLKFDYIIRFRECTVIDQRGRASRMESGFRAPDARRCSTPRRSLRASTCCQPSCLCATRRCRSRGAFATSRADLNAPDVVKLYGRRFTIEETFRDQKDFHFGIGLSAARIKSAARRNRLLLLAALAHALLTLRGAAGEPCGLDRMRKTNTSKKR